MATSYPISVNGVVIKTPSSFKISSYNLSKSGRVSSGKMTIELIAKKKKLFLSYKVISSAELQIILDQIDGNDMFFTVGYYDTNNVYRTATCYVGEIPAELQRRASLGGKTYWQNVDFNFIEQ